ncbi:hypothetical protein L0P88_13800 [Muricauda sp. SCSIO 64092]|uniref:hypothetical protein n=1 Tax=Allomuricauda sp. SCSIO 64092 TaxID=2908842 RepID=UPI001FF437EF|nr:hypothetical protein [Muricauda sp. SCSIO 64092]UOY05026.1 hypothetical protein L0P88_13800 [Muricauda sp. SCSIO 64092]
MESHIGRRTEDRDCLKQLELMGQNLYQVIILLEEHLDVGAIQLSEHLHSRICDLEERLSNYIKRNSDEKK